VGIPRTRGLLYSSFQFWFNFGSIFLFFDCRQLQVGFCLMEVFDNVSYTLFNFFSICGRSLFYVTNWHFSQFAFSFFTRLFCFFATLIVEDLGLWSFRLYESWVIYENLNMCDQDFRILEFQKLKTSWALFESWRYSAYILPSCYLWEGMVAEEKKNKQKYFFFLFGTQSKARAGWPAHLRLVRATPRSDFAVLGDQLWSTMTGIFPWVHNFASNNYLQPRFWDCCQIFKISGLFLLVAGLFPFSLSEMLWDTCISEYLHQDSSSQQVL